MSRRRRARLHDGHVLNRMPPPGGGAAGRHPLSTGGVRPDRNLVDRLAAAGCVAAEEEGRELVQAAPDPGALDSLVRRRQQGEPLAWITGTAPFWGHRLQVGAGVYVPRLQTEELARRGAQLLAARGHDARAVDLCTGAGAVAVHLMRSVPAATVVAVDVDEHAALWARRNGVRVVVGDLGTALRSHWFDVVTAVAPYVPTADLRFLPADVRRYEPLHALDGGGDGLNVVRRVVECAARILRPGGWLLVEVGGDQDRQLAQVLHAHGFTSIESWSDQDDDLRGLVAGRPMGGTA